MISLSIQMASEALHPHRNALAIFGIPASQKEGGFFLIFVKNKKTKNDEKYERNHRRQASWEKPQKNNETNGKQQRWIDTQTHTQNENASAVCQTDECEMKSLLATKKKNQPANVQVNALFIECLFEFYKLVYQ